MSIHFVGVPVILPGILTQPTKNSLLFEFIFAVMDQLSAAQLWEHPEQVNTSELLDVGVQTGGRSYTVCSYWVAVLVCEFF